jgi:hypothetical protein
VSSSAWIERTWLGRKGSPAAKRAPNGASTSSMNSSLLVYSLDASECPSIRHTMSGAKMSAIAPVPSCHAWKARRTDSRLASVSVGSVIF